MRNIELENSMTQKYGPLLGGEDLWKCLGFKTRPAFYKAVKTGKLNLNVFKVNGRRGLFALTCDVCEWLQDVSTRDLEA